METQRAKEQQAKEEEPKDQEELLIDLSLGRPPRLDTLAEHEQTKNNERASQEQEEAGRQLLIAEHLDLVIEREKRILESLYESDGMTVIAGSLLHPTGEVLKPDLTKERADEIVKSITVAEFSPPPVPVTSLPPLPKLDESEMEGLGLHRDGDTEIGAEWDTQLLYLEESLKEISIVEASLASKLLFQPDGNAREFLDRLQQIKSDLTLHVETAEDLLSFH